MHPVDPNSSEETQPQSFESAKAAVPLDFIDYLGSQRGMRRGAASALLGEWLLARHQARSLDAMADQRAPTPPAEANDLERRARPNASLRKGLRDSNEQARVAPLASGAEDHVFSMKIGSAPTREKHIVSCEADTLAILGN